MEPAEVNGGRYFNKFNDTWLSAVWLHVFEEFAGQGIVDGRIADGMGGFLTQSENTRSFVPGAPPDEFAPAWAIVGRMSDENTDAS
jgi:hypothetical protein